MKQENQLSIGSDDTDEDSNTKIIITVEEAFAKTGGFGKFQKFQILMNTIANSGSAFFMYAFSFLEKEPIFKCKLPPSLGFWTNGNV